MRHRWPETQAGVIADLMLSARSVSPLESRRRLIASGVDEPIAETLAEIIWRDVSRL